MALADHTYSFRAPRDLADRLRAAERAYVVLAGDAAVAAHVSRELEIELHRRLRETAPKGRGQGRILRDVIEAFVAATEEAASEEAIAAELRAFDAGDADGDAERAALLRASTAGRD